MSSVCRQCQRAGGTTTVTDARGRQVRVTWSATYGRHDISWWDVDRAGARRRRRRRATRHDDALAAARSALWELNHGKDGGVAAVDTTATVQSLAEQWMAEVLVRDRARSGGYLKRCRSLVRVWVPRLGTVGEWTEEATVALLTQMTSVSSRRQLLSLLRQVSRWAHRAGYIGSDVVRDVELDQRRNGPRRGRHQVRGVAPSPATADVERLLQAIRATGDAGSAVVVGLMAYSGLRRGEAFAVAGEQVDGHRLTVDRAVDVLRTAARRGHVVEDGVLLYWRTEWGCLQLPKGGKMRTTVVPSPIHEEVHALVDSRGPATPLSLTATGLLAANYSQWDVGTWRPAAVQAGWPLHDDGRPVWTTRSLRGHAAEWMMEAGLPMRGVADLLGHTSMSTTDFHYIASSRDVVDRAWAMTSTTP